MLENAKFSIENDNKFIYDNCIILIRKVKFVFSTFCMRLAKKKG